MDADGSQSPDPQAASSAYEPAPRCPNCQSQSLYTTTVSAGTGDNMGSRVFNLLPGLGSFLSVANLRVVLCSECGHMQFFADSDAQAKVAKAAKWEKVLPGLKPMGFVKPEAGSLPHATADPNENERQAFLSQAIAALRNAGMEVSNETRGEYVLLEKEGVWLDLGGYFGHRGDADIISRIVERAREMCQK